MLEVEGILFRGHFFLSLIRLTCSYRIGQLIRISRQPVLTCMRTLATQYPCLIMSAATECIILGLISQPMLLVLISVCILYFSTAAMKLNAYYVGPKMYNSFASSQESGSRGSTRLHMDMADALNVMLHAEPCPDGSEGYAVWDLYRAEDSDKIRAFLKKRFGYNPASNSANGSNAGGISKRCIYMPFFLSLLSSYFLLQCRRKGHRPRSTTDSDDRPRWNTQSAILSRC